MLRCPIVVPLELQTVVPASVDIVLSPDLRKHQSRLQGLEDEHESLGGC